MSYAKVFAVTLGSLAVTAMLTFAQPSRAAHEEWNRRWNGPTSQNDAGAKVATDAAGNVYVTGPSGGHYSMGTQFEGSDYRTIKYAPNGTELWNRRYDGTGHLNDTPVAIATDSAGDVYVTGTSQGAGANYYYDHLDYATVKYDTHGTLLWARRYDGPVSGTDRPTGLAVDGAGNAYVTGVSDGAGTGADYLTIKYNAAGNQVWLRRYDSAYAPYDYDYADAIALDHSGNVCVTGHAGVGVTTIEYSATGNTLWTTAESIGGYTTYLALDGSNDVYVTSSFSGPNTVGYQTFKYDAAGHKLWTRQYDSNDYDDFDIGVVADNAGNAYITGNSGNDFATIKYAPNGDQLWLRRYNGPESAGYSNPASIALDPFGDLYITGLHQSDSGNVDFATVKYGSDGRQHWDRLFDGPTHGYDSASGIAIDPFGSVLITGYSSNTSTGYDFRTVKYSQ